MTVNQILEGAMSHLNQGQGKKALQKAKAAMHQAPKSPHPYNIAGLSLSSLGKHGEAAKYFLRATKLAPDYADAHRNLAQALIQSGRFDTARSVLSTLLGKHVSDGSSWYLFAQCEYMTGRFHEAEDAATKAVDLEPNSGRNRNLRAVIRDKLGDLPGSLEEYEAALRTDPMNVETLVNISVPLARSLRVPEALEALNKAVSLAPNHLGARQRLAMHLVEAGKKAAAIDAFKAVLALDKTNGLAMEQLAQLQTPLQNVNLVKDAKRALNTASKRSENRASLFFALAAVARQANDQKAEIDALKKANGEMSSLMPYNYKSEVEWESLICRRFPQEIQLPDSEIHTPNPIYIVGLPRSGTTLAEAVLGAHRQVAPLGERAAAGILLKDILEKDLPFDEVSVRLFCENDSKLLPEMAPEVSAYVDKMPENYRLVGFLKTAYPHCKIINMVRDPRDVALSMWRGHFSGSALNYTYDLQSMAHRFNIYARMMRHWYSVLPNQIFDVRYEELVSDLPKISSEMAEYCDLEWAEKMAAPHQSVTQVMTLSASQVREPVNEKSVGGWRKYEASFEEFTDALDAELWGHYLH